VTHLMTDVAPTPGWEGDIVQASNPMPPYRSRNHMGICGMINVFVGNFPGLPGGLDPNSAQFLEPAYTYLSPVDERTASQDVLSGTPCVASDVEKRCVGNLAQACQIIGGRKLFYTVNNCNELPAGGDFVQMCQRSTGQCCIPGLGHGGTCE